MPDNEKKDGHYYDEKGNRIPTSTELLARVLNFPVSSSFNFTREPKATDLSPVKLRKPEEKK